MIKIPRTSFASSCISYISTVTQKLGLHEFLNWGMGRCPTILGMASNSKIDQNQQQQRMIGTYFLQFAHKNLPLNATQFGNPCAVATGRLMYKK